MKECHLSTRWSHFSSCFSTSPGRSRFGWCSRPRRGGWIFFVGNSLKVVDSKIQKFSWFQDGADERRIFAFWFLSLRDLQIEDGYEEVIAQFYLIHQLLMGDVIRNHSQELTRGDLMCKPSGKKNREASGQWKNSPGCLRNVGDEKLPSYRGLW